MILCLVISLCTPLTAKNPIENDQEKEREVESIFSAFQKMLEKDPDNISLLMALGEGYFSYQEYLKAIPLFKKILKIEPDNQKAKIYLGLSYLFTNQLEQASQLLQEVLPKKPKNPNVLSGLARIADLEQHRDEAEKLYSEALQIDPDHLMTLSFYGNFLIEQKRYQQAEEIYKKIEQLYPEKTWVKKVLIRLKSAPTLDAIKQLEDQGKIQEAIDGYKQFISTHPQLLTPYLFLGELYTKIHQYGDALNTYREGLKQFPDAGKLITAMGFTYLSQRNFDKAKVLFEESLAKNPDDPETITGLGRIAALTGQDEEAERLYTQALAIEPSNPTTLTYYADLLMKQKQYKRAESLFEVLLRVEPNTKWVKDKLFETQYGSILDEIKEDLLQKNNEAAEKLYLQLIEEAPYRPHLYAALGQLYVRLHAYQKAIDLYELGLERNPNTIDLQLGLAFAYLHHGDRFIGEKILSDVLKKDPQNVEALVGIGLIAQYQGNLEQAESLYNRALDLDLDNITALFYLAELNMLQKRYQEAEELFKRILQLDPNSIRAMEGLEQAKHGPILEKIKLKESENDVLFAESLYLQLIAEAPKIATYYLGLGRLYEHNNQLQKAIALYQQGLEKLPDNHPLQVALGFAYLSRNDVKASSRLFHSILKEDSENAEALAGLGRIAEDGGHKKTAEKLYKQALSYEPDNITALAYLGRLLLKEKHFQEGQKIFQQLNLSYPNAAWIKEDLDDAVYGPLLEKIHDLEMKKDLSPEEERGQQLELEKLYRELVSQAPGNLKYLFRLGLLYAQMRRFPEAIATYQRGLKIDPTANFLRVSMGFSYLYNEDFYKAKEAFQEALEQDPHDAEAWTGLGRLAELTKNFSEAENDYANAVEYGPNNLTALSFMARFQVEQGNFKEAAKYYQKLEALEPDAKWVQIAMQSAEFGPQLENIHQLIDDQEFDQAVQMYEKLISEATYNTDYYTALAKLYLQRKLYEKAIAVLRKGLEEHPNNINIQSGLATAYVLDKDVANAKKYYEKVNAAAPNHSEVLAGLARVAFLEGHPKRAEKLFIEAINRSPDNVSALSFYGEFLMEQKRYDEAAKLYAHLLEIDPNSYWVRRALKRAQQGPELDGVIALMDLGKYQAAERHLLQLVSLSPDMIDYYYYLGEVYVACELYDLAINYYWQGLVEFYQQNWDTFPKAPETCCDPKNERLWCLITPDNAYLWRAIAFAFLEKGDITSSCRIFCHLLYAKSDDADAWIGIGRIQALTGHFCCAKENYLHALNLDPQKLSTLSYLALWDADAEYYFSARDLYGCLLDRDPQRWLKISYKRMYDLTRPRFELFGAYHEENEWDDTVDKWTARYQAYGWRGQAIWPLNDYWRVFSHFTNEYYRLRDLLDDRTLYYFKLFRCQFGGKYVIQPNLTAEAAMGVTAYFPAGRSTFDEETGILPEPTLLLNFHEPRQRATIGISSNYYDRLLVFGKGIFPFYQSEETIARDFENNRAKFVGRYFFLGRYEREVLHQTLIGVDGAAYFYDDFVRNTSQRILGWALWRPILFSDILSLGYRVQYWRFRKNIPDYYTFRYQITNQVQAELRKDWCESLYATIGYAYGWLNIRTRFGEIIVIPTGVPTALPFFTQHRRYQYGYFSIDYNEDPLQLSINGDYYRDSEKYTIWTLYGKLSWLF